VLMPATVHRHGLRAKMSLFRDESFGPVVAIVRARRNEAHAIELANDTEYADSRPLCLHGTAGARGLRVAHQIRSGICHINGPTVP